MKSGMARNTLKKRDISSGKAGSSFLCLSDEGEGFEPTGSMLSLQEGHYFALGRMLTSMLLQGGGVTPSLSHTFLQYGLHGCQLRGVGAVQASTQAVIDRVSECTDRLIFVVKLQYLFAFVCVIIQTRES